ncbi:transcript variant X1 [Nothobranchius furzeri]|uniref:Transcript variant X1 n=1 Tax=Nothobranchius furzeri TaxID=105023 RepID=A0A9D3BJZ0_NOTFU|nr:transcript variant X1 [Nothobranchius furzeri]
MPVFCAAYGCNNRRTAETRSRGITFHKFPRDTESKREWEVALRRKDFVATEFSKICSDHFEPEDFDRTGQTVRLRDGVIPSRFNFPSKRRVCAFLFYMLTEDHSYALSSSPTHLKARLSQALARVESLERENLNSKARERRTKNIIKGLLEILKDKILINELKEGLDVHSDVPMDLSSKQSCENKEDQRRFALTLNIHGPRTSSPDVSTDIAKVDGVFGRQAWAQPNGAGHVAEKTGRRPC